MTRVTMRRFFKKIMGLFNKRKTLLVIGDSHASIFNNKKLRRSLWPLKISVCWVGGATVSGLENPNSKTQALPLFTESYQKSQPDYVVVLIGEVDTGFVIWWRAEKYNKPIKEMLDKSVENYAKLLQQFKGHDKTIAISTPLPTIKDDQNWGDVANARSEVKASQFDRTKLTLEFNQMVEQVCLKENCDFVSLDKYSLGDNGLVISSLLNNNPSDHHYDQNQHAALIIKELTSLLKLT
jgi:hypothetical protein